MFETGRNLWYSACNEIATLGEDRGSRDGHCKEIMAWQGVLSDANKSWVGGRSQRYAAAEFAWYMSGDATGWIKHYAPSYGRFLNDNGRADGAYGFRWARNSQLEFVMNELTADTGSRRAVMTCWDQSTDTKNITQGTKDAPCTLSLQFLMRKGRLHCIATMRSNDAWYGLPYDMFCFTAVQRLLAFRLGVEVGTYTHQVGSLHQYSRNSDKDLKPFSELDELMWQPVTCSEYKLVAFERAARNNRVLPERPSGLFGHLADFLVPLSSRSGTKRNP